ncbi:MAG: 50S ribosome-binding GTPase [Deltaproteobacteria bacterium]|nr:50S ribosome-binding GTPase [Deltaproteobacteria bacterium]
MAQSNDYTRDEIEAGRLLFAGDWRFVAAASSDVSLPPMRGSEIAFAGRSNVGKSSLVNALIHTNREQHRTANQ